jgi:hypothetical protein
MDIVIYYTLMHNTVNSLSAYIQDIIRLRHSLKLTKKPTKVNTLFWAKVSHSLSTKAIKRLKNGVN